MKLLGAFTAIGLLIGSSGIAPMPLQAAVILDQNALVGPLIPVGPRPGRLVVAIGNRPTPSGTMIAPLVDAKVAQSVTAGLSGVLAGIEVQGPYWTGSPLDTFLRFSLYNGDIGAGGSFVGSYDRPANSFPNGSSFLGNTFYFDTTGFGFSVETGKMFSFGLEIVQPTTGSAIFLVGNVPGLNGNGMPIVERNAYSGGTLYSSNNGSSFRPGLADIGFRSFVDTSVLSAVPEPSVWLIMIIGFGFVGTQMRRRSAAKFRKFCETPA